MATTLRRGPTSRTIENPYVVMDVKNEHNVIFGRTEINAFEAIASTVHLKLKWPTDYGVGELRGCKAESSRTYQDDVNIAT